MAISSPGIGSNLDVNGIVSKLMSIEAQPLTALAKKEASYQAQLSAYGSLRGALSSFQSAVSALNNPSKFTSLTTSVGDSTVLTASAASTAIAGTHSLQVTTLAQAQAMRTNFTAANVTDAVGTGSLTFYFGTYDSVGNTFTANPSKGAQTVTIDAAHNSLSGVRDAINGANMGVSASIINDGTTNRLVLTSTSTGAANSLKIAVNDDDGNNTDMNGLSQVAYDPTAVAGSGKNMVQTLAALDAVLSVDGISITKSSNTVTDAIQGVTLNLLKTTTAATSVTVAQDTGGISSAVQSFVKAYNDLHKTFSDLTSYDPKTQQAGILQGDSVVRSIQSKITSMLGKSIMALDGSQLNLVNIGVNFQKDGTLALDTAKLQSAITNNPTNVMGLFAATGKPTDSLVQYLKSTGSTQAGNYALSVSALATQGNAVGTAADIHGYAVGASALSPSIVIPNPAKTLNITVDGQAVSLTLAGTYTPAQLATEVQTQVNAALTGGRAITADATNNIITLSSNSIGPSSSISAISGDAASIIFGGTAKTTTGVRINTGSNDGLTLSVDGVTASVTLSAGVYSTTDLVAEVQSKINGATAFSSAGVSVAVSQAAGVFTITSNRYGSASNVSVTGNGLATLLGTPTSTAGVDVAGTLGGMAASGSGQTLTGSAGGASGLAVQVLGSTLGSRGNVVYAQGFAFQLDSLMTSLLGSTGPLTGATNSINSIVTDIGRQRDALNSRLADTETRYRAQFTALDTMISQMTQTQNYLTQQLANLPKITG